MRLIFIALFSFLSTVTVWAAEPVKPAKKMTWMDAEYKTVKSMHEVPARVMTSMLLKMPNDRRLAERHAKYNAGRKSDSLLPERRFILAGISERYVLVVYEHGTRNFHHHLVVFNVAGPKPRLILAAQSPYSLNSIKEIKKYGVKGVFKNDVNNPKAEW